MDYPRNIWQTCFDPKLTMSHMYIRLTSEEMEAALTRSLGTLTFRLQNMDFLKDFEPSEHAGRRMQAKGYLIRQPDRARIDLTSMQAASAECSRD